MKQKNNKIKNTVSREIATTFPYGQVVSRYQMGLHR